MKIKIPVIIEDQLTQNLKSIGKPTEDITIEDEIFLDGPISNRVAVLDFDENGILRECAKFEPLYNSEKPGNYKGANHSDLIFLSNEFVQVNVFGVVYRTLEMCEEPDALGRKIKWAFNSPQLLLVPKAGKWANAYYQRDSHSIQFFYFPSRRDNNETIFTSLSHDIIAHETGHAILDGIAPDLYNSLTPQSLALHESIADLTALILSFRSRPLRETVLKQTNGSIKNSTAFSMIATEFGANQVAGEMRPLRNLYNDKKLPNDGSVRTEPHELSEILSGALYSVMIKIFDHISGKRMIEMNLNRFQASGYALYVAGEQFKRMIFRALDYLPPGEISFADYGRAIVAADKASHPLDLFERQWIAEEFTERNIVKDPSELLDVEIESKRKSKIEKALSGMDINLLVESDWVAYDFANRNKVLLGIPSDVTFEIRPRLDIKKRYYHRNGPEEVRECLFKISWKQIEKNPPSQKIPSKRIISQGMTIAIDWQTKKVRSFLTTDKSESQKVDRDNMLLNLKNLGILQINCEEDGVLRQGVVPYFVSGDTMKVKNTAQMLHIHKSC